MNKLTSLMQIKQYKPKPLLDSSHKALGGTLKYFQADSKFNSLSFCFWFKKDQHWEVLEKMNRIGWLADEIDHHPEWKLSENNLMINLSTHDIGNKISLKDYILASYVESVLFGKGPESQLFENWNKKKIGIEELLEGKHPQ